MSTEWNSVSLDSLGVLRVRGADLVSFLQGQLSNDVALLGPERSLLAGYHNPQGRVIAVLRLIQAVPGGGSLPGALNDSARLGDSIAVRIGALPARWLVLSPVGASLAGYAPLEF